MTTIMKALKNLHFAAIFGKQKYLIAIMKKWPGLCSYRYGRVL